MSTNAPSSDLANRLVASVCQAGSARTSPQLYRALLRLLARGEPVTLAELAAAAGRRVDDVRQAVAEWRDTEVDEHGRIVGWALTLRPTPHSFTVDGKRLYTWCALDTLFFPAIIGRPADVESKCAATGRTIRLTVDPIAGVTALDPPTAVVSVVTPEKVSSVRTAFCNPGRFFVTRETASQRLAETKDIVILPVADAYRISRPLAALLLDDCASSACCPA